MDNKNDLLRIGMSIQNEIVVAHAQNVLAVPTYAIKNDREGYFVEILEKDRVRKAYVKLGIKDALNTEILDGVSEGENLVISSSLEALAPAMKFGF